jgi:ABC-type dipeptide/oligopeptide/nickel transport system permease subunit
MQLDLSKFEPATDSEKRQQQQMGKSTTFFRDGMKSLFKNPLAVGSIIVLLLVIFVIIFAPLFCPYGYDQIIEVDGVKDTSTKNLHPFQYSDAETLYRANNAVFMGWSTKRISWMLDSQEAVDKVLADADNPLVTSSITIEKNVTLYAVYGVDNDGDGAADFGKDLFDYSQKSNKAGTAAGEAQSYRIKYNINIREGTVPDETRCAAGDIMVPSTEVSLEPTGRYVAPHLFGTDDLGRDYFIRVIYGTRVSLAVGLFASLIVLIIGLLYGSIAGYVGGKTDLIMMRIVDIIYSLPDMLVVVLLSSVFDSVFAGRLEGTIFAKLGSDMISIFLVFGLLYWVGMARLVRGQILSIKEQEYVLAAKSLGAKPGRIIRKHILPNCISVIIISTALQIPSAIFTESFLSFVGLGVQAPMPSLGSLANAARSGLPESAYKLLFPAGAICLIVLAFNLLGDGLRDAFDPKLRR